MLLTVVLETWKSMNCGYFKLPLPFDYVLSTLASKHPSADCTQDQGDNQSQKRGRLTRDDEFGTQHKFQRTESGDQFSGEEDMSD